MKKTILSIILLMIILSFCFSLAAATDIQVPTSKTTIDLMARVSDPAGNANPVSIGVSTSGEPDPSAHTVSTQSGDEDGLKTGVVAPAIEWQKCLGGTDWDEAYSIQQTSDGGYIVAGAAGSSNGMITDPKGNYDYWVVKLTKTGAITWKKNIGGSYTDYARSVQQTSDGEYIVAGYSGSSDKDMPSDGWAIWLVKLTGQGDISWKNRYKFEIPGSIDLPNAFSVRQTSDGGYIVAGTLGNSGYSNSYVIVKFTATGNYSWRQVLGGASGDTAYSVSQTIDGGYIVAGYTSGTAGDVLGHHGLADYRVVKLTSTGIIEWQKCLGGSGDDVAYSIQQTTDEGYIVAGSSKSNNDDVKRNYGGNDYWVVKISRTGSILWQNNYGGSSDDVATSIQQTADGGYIIAGYTGSTDKDVTGNHGYLDVWVIKLTSSGGLSWQKCLGGSYYDVASSIWQTIDGGYIIGGMASSSDGDVKGLFGGKDYWVVKLAGAQPAPTISGISPSIGYPTANWQVTISGKNFRSGVAATITRKGVSKSAAIQRTSSTRIKATLPTKGIAIGTYSLTVSNTDGTSATKSNAFTVKAAGKNPTLKTISPKTGLTSANKRVTITGSNFRKGAIVQMIKGGYTRTGTIISRGSSKIICALPTKGAVTGSWNIKITNADQTSVTRTKGFTVKRTASDEDTIGVGTVSSGVSVSPVRMPSPGGFSTGYALSAGGLVPVNGPVAGQGVPVF